MPRLVKLTQLATSSRCYDSQVRERLNYPSFVTSVTLQCQCEGFKKGSDVSSGTLTLELACIACANRVVISSNVSWLTYGHKEHTHTWNSKVSLTA